jgi:hypothetical protein
VHQVALVEIIPDLTAFDPGRQPRRVQIRRNKSLGCGNSLVVLKDLNRLRAFYRFGVFVENLSFLTGMLPLPWFISLIVFCNYRWSSSRGGFEPAPFSLVVISVHISRNRAVKVKKGFDSIFLLL